MSMSGHSPRSSDRKRSNSSSMAIGSTAVIDERVAHRRVGRRAAPLGEDAAGAAEAHDVVDDQEVAGEAEALDERQLAVELGAHPRRR